LPDILKEIPVLLFSGEFDLICNYVGTEYLIGNMTWNGGRGFTKKHTKKEIWKIDDKLAGYYTQERNLTYVLIKDGSHMVPYDRPIECLDMINRFIQVGNNIVKGRISQVGDRTVVSPSPSSSSVPVSTPSSKDDKSNKSTDSAGQQDKDTTSDDKWGEYYSWGTTTLIFVILFAISLCWCWLRTRNRPSSASAAVEFGGAPQQQREDIKKRSDGILGFVTKLFSNKVNGRKKFRLGDNEESNEL
jgi:carboxypeptidase D